MLQVGKCPKCEKVLDHIKLESIDVGFAPEWHGLAYLCPFCNTILSVGIDPIALKNSLAERILKEITHR